MERHPIGDLMDTTLSKISEMVDVNTIVGNPITTPDDITIIPISKVTFGFTSGGADFPIKESAGFGGGGGAGVKIEPIGFLTIANGVVKMINIEPPASSTLDRVVDLAPEIIDKVQQMVDKFRS